MSDIKSLSARYFDINAGDYTNDYYISQVTHPKWQRQHAIEKIIKKFIKPSSSKILNLGCGPGLLEEALSKQGYSGIGIDASPEMIELSVERSNKNNFKENWQFFVGDCEETKIENTKFDCVVASGLIEYMPEDEKLLKESYRLLKNNGLLILNVTNFFGWSTSLNRITHYIKKVDKFIYAANFIKKKFFKENIKAKRLDFIPRKHVPFLFLKKTKKNNFDFVLAKYQGFTLLPAPLDLIMNLFPGNLNSKLEFLQNTPLKYFGASYLVVLKKK